MVHCLGERAHFSCSFVAVFWWFLPLKASILLYDICYWWFFLSQGNRWTKYLVCLKIQRSKTCLLMLEYLVILDGFACCCQLSWLWIEVKDLCFIHCHILKRKLLFVALKQLTKNSLNHRHIVIFDQLWANVAPTWNIAFSLTNVHENGKYILISSNPVLCHATWIYDRPKGIYGVCENHGFFKIIGAIYMSGS